MKRNNTRRGGFTLVEIMIVVAIIALLAAIAVPNFMRARKRAMGSQMLQDLRILNDAVEQYAIDTGKTTGATYYYSDLLPYLKVGTRLYENDVNNNMVDPFGNSYCSSQQIDVADPGDGTSIVINLKTFNALSDVCPLEYWSPYGVQP
jgi:prepilin-type N-terminal cleavage/methylation domain-containing protein